MLDEHQQWLKDFYQEHQWYQLSPFIRQNFISEEVGELARAVRAIEIGRNHPGEKPASDTAKADNLEEELADTLDQILVLAAKYHLSGTDLLRYSERKLQRRFDLTDQDLSITARTIKH